MLTKNSKMKRDNHSTLTGTVAHIKTAMSNHLSQKDSVSVFCYSASVSHYATSSSRSMESFLNKDKFKRSRNFSFDMSCTRDVNIKHYNRENGQKLSLSFSYHSRKLVVTQKRNL